MKKPQLYQIYYDEQTRLELDPGFAPLDNMANARPDWFEFFVIRKFLLQAPLQEDTWYGFFSPKFRARTGLRAADVLNVLQAVDANADVALFSHGWDQIAYFLNPFEQGEFWHPGLTELSQQFLDKQGIRLNLRAYVAHSSSSVFSNFLVAKPAFWREWLALANAFFDEVETGNSALAQTLRGTTSYGNRAGSYPAKTFIQERFAPVLLATRGFRVVNPHLSNHFPVLDHLFHNDLTTRRRLATCDSLKQDYLLTKDESYMDMYEKVRATIALRTPISTSFL